MTLPVTQPGKVEPAGRLYPGNPWADLITLPTVQPGTPVPLNFTASTFTVDTAGLPAGIVPSVTFNPTAGTVVIALSAAQTALVTGTWRWWLRETPVFGGAAWLRRTVLVGDDRT